MSERTKIGKSVPNLVRNWQESARTHENATDFIPRTSPTMPFTRKFGNWLELGYSSIGETCWVTIRDRVQIFVGVSGFWGIEAKYDHWDRSFMIMLIHWYAGIQVFSKDEE